MVLEPHQELRQIVSGELPLEGPCHLLVMLLEAQQAIPQPPARSKIIGREHLALYDREVDLHLVEPAGMNGCVDGDEGRPSAAESLVTLRAAVGRAVVHDPENASGRAVGPPPHHLRDQPSKGGDACLELTAAEDLGPPDVPGREIRPGALPFVLVLDSHRLARPRRSGGVNPPAGLDAGLLVAGDHEISSGQQATLPDALVQIQDGPRLLFELGVAREDPASMAPGADRIFIQPAPQCRLADRGDEAAAQDLSLEFRNAIAGQREAAVAGKPASQGLNGDGPPGGKSGWAVHPGTVPPARRVVARRSACATSRRSGEVCRAEPQSRHWPIHPRRRGQSWRARRPYMVTYISGQVTPVRFSRSGRVR